MQFKWEKGINEKMIQNDKEKMAALALMGIYQHKNIQSKEIKPCFNSKVLHMGV